jgi:redox-sensitive bicupin YhaK (pirin superfamily)
MEIVTWVLDGELEHHDSAGNHDVIRPGLAQRMSAGRGITHSEMNASRDEPVHFVQMWVLPDVRGIDPSYEQRDLGDALSKPALVAVASGRGHDGAVAIHQHDAVLWAARLAPGDAITVPDAPHVHVFVARGDARLEGAGELATGDGSGVWREPRPHLCVDQRLAPLVRRAVQPSLGGPVHDRRELGELRSELRNSRREALARHHLVHETFLRSFTR